MAIKASNQVDLLDMTDGYTVVLTNDNYTFLGTTTAVNGTQTTSTQVMALQGSETVPAKIGTITCPTGISAVSDGKTPMPTITITATSALTKTGSFTIPIIVNEGTVNEVTINKVFSYSIAFKGNQGIQGTSVKISSKSIQYVGSSSGTTTPTSGWQDTIPSVSAGNYLWTKTTVTYSDGTSTVSYSVARQGANGSSPTVSKTATEYVQSTSGTTTPTSGWSTTPPAATAGQYIWTRVTVTYSDSKTAISYTVSKNGANGAKGDKGDKGETGAKGDDAIYMNITSSNGNVFKNTAIATTLTAHVYKGATELTGAAITALGTIKWYKDGGTTSIATGQTFTVSAGDVTNKATYTAQLEG